MEFQIGNEFRRNETRGNVIQQNFFDFERFGIFRYAGLFEGNVEFR